MMRRSAIVLVLAVAGFGAFCSPASGLMEAFTRFSPNNATAACLSATGKAGGLSLLARPNRRQSPVDLLGVEEGGLRPGARVSLGLVEECPVVAAAGGRTLIAGPAITRGRRRISARMLEADGHLSSVAILGRPSAFIPSSFSAAVSPSGEAVVAWAQYRTSHRITRSRVRVLVARRPAGGRFGRASVLLPWTRISEDRDSSAPVAVGIDPQGHATVAFTRPVHRPRIPDLSEVRVSTASPGAPFGRPQVLSRLSQDTRTLALTGSADGRALLAHDGNGAVTVFDRSSPTERFGRRATFLPPRSGLSEFGRPAVALRRGGGALVAWRDAPSDDDGGVLVSTRTGPGPLRRPRRVAKNNTPNDGSSFGLVGYGGVFAPDDPADRELQAALADSGEALLAWTAPRHTGLGDHPRGARFSAGSLSDGFARPVTLGCACRTANAVAPLALPGGGMAGIWTDNLSARGLGLEDEFASVGGRLHVAVAAAQRAPAAAPPALAVSGPRRVRLRYGQTLNIRARCATACDLRAVAPPARRARNGALATASSGGGRLVELRLGPSFEQNIARRRPGPVRVIVRAYARGAPYPFSERRLTVFARRRPVLRPPLPIAATASRHGNRVAVRWRTAHRPLGDFSVGLLRSRHGEPVAERQVKRRRGLSYRTSLRYRRGVRFVRIISGRDRPPYTSRRVVLRIR
jgi:hypothetical protein